jgi:hypothetical protein
VETAPPVRTALRTTAVKLVVTIKLNLHGPCDHRLRDTLPRSHALWAFKNTECTFIDETGHRARKKDQKPVNCKRIGQTGKSVCGQLWPFLLDHKTGECH